MKSDPSKTVLFRDPVSKNNPRLVLRGKLDSIAAFSTYVCNQSNKLIDYKIKTESAQTVNGQICVLYTHIKTLQTYEATGSEHIVKDLLCDARSHKYEECSRLDNGWIDPVSELGCLVNILRTKIREAELVAWQLNSSGDFDETVYNTGVILNMMSSQCVGIMKESERYFTVETE